MTTKATKDTRFARFVKELNSALEEMILSCEEEKKESKQGSEYANDMQIKIAILREIRYDLVPEIQETINA